MKIYFLDVTCPKPYSKRDLDLSAMGGTEASVIRVAHGLAAKGADVHVFQWNRSTQDYDNGVSYRPLSAFEGSARPDSVIVLRDPKVCAFVNKHFPDAKLACWMHDLSDASLTSAVPVINEVGCDLIAVSKYHKNDIIRLVQMGLPKDHLNLNFKVTYIHNPLGDDVIRTGAKKDLNKFIWVSSPHKGLEHAIKLFKYVVYKYPDSKLHVANPGYLKMQLDLPEYVVDLGELQHTELMEEIETSFAVFYPNVNFSARETFGIFAAEAQALGTPVIAHRMGALPEVIGDTHQFANCYQPEDVVKKVVQYKTNYPNTIKNEAFDLDNIIEDWVSYLNRS